MYLQAPFSHAMLCPWKTQRIAEEGAQCNRKGPCANTSSAGAKQATGIIDLARPKFQFAMTQTITLQPANIRLLLADTCFSPDIVIFGKLKKKLHMKQASPLALAYFYPAKWVQGQWCSLLSFLQSVAHLLPRFLPCHLLPCSHEGLTPLYGKVPNLSSSAGL